MSDHHNEKVIGQIQELAAKFFHLESNQSSLVTITRVDTNDDGHKALIFFTVLPESKEQEALEFAKRKRSDFREYVKKNSRLGRIPFFDFLIDIGEKNRQLIDRVSSGS